MNDPFNVTKKESVVHIFLHALDETCTRGSQQ